MTDLRGPLSDEQICLGLGNPHAHGSATPPLVQTSMFLKPDFETLINELSAEHNHHVYTRGQNPTVEVLEHQLAQLEQGEACKCLASGMGAVSAVLTGLLDGGDHVVFGNQIYGPTLQLAERLTRFGIQYSHVTSTDTHSITEALRPETRILYLENPGTMLFGFLDLPALVERAHQRDVLVVMDNSWATPLYYKPLNFGVDVVVQACSKYIGGHSDVMAGAIIARADLLQQIFYNAYLLFGASLGPFDAWLLIRGLRTLPIRMRAHQAGAERVAQFLNGHPRVRSTNWPGLDQDACRAAGFSGASGLMSFEPRVSNFEGLCRFIDTLESFSPAVSWGGPESLVIAPNNGRNLEQLERLNIPPFLVRLSIGLEEPDRLIGDLDQALKQIQ